MNNIFLNNINFPIISSKEYYTNIIDEKRISKCIKFLSEGCTSYAISFDNKKESHIYSSKLKNVDIRYLRDINFKQIFISKALKDLTDSRMILQKGYDLIELL